MVRAQVSSSFNHWPLLRGRDCLLKHISHPENKAHSPCLRTMYLFINHPWHITVSVSLSVFVNGQKVGQRNKSCRKASQGQNRDDIRQDKFHPNKIQRKEGLGHNACLTNDFCLWNYLSNHFLNPHRSSNKHVFFNMLYYMRWSQQINANNDPFQLIIS